MFGRKKAVLAEEEGGIAKGLLKGRMLVDRLKRESRPPGPGESGSRDGSPAPARAQGHALASSSLAEGSAAAGDRRPSRPSRKSVDLHAGPAPGEGTYAMSASQLADWHKQRAAEHAHLAAVAAAAAAKFGPVESEGSESDDMGTSRGPDASRAGRRRSVDANSSKQSQRGPDAAQTSHPSRRKSVSGDLAPPSKPTPVAYDPWTEASQGRTQQSRRKSLSGDVAPPSKPTPGAHEPRAEAAQGTQQSRRKSMSGDLVASSKAPHGAHEARAEASHGTQQSRRVALSGDLGASGGGGGRRRSSIDGGAAASTEQPRELRSRGSFRERESDRGAARTGEGGGGRGERPDPWAFDAEPDWESPIASSDPVLKPVAPLQPEQKLTAEAPSDRPHSASERHDPGGAAARALRHPRASPLNPSTGRPGHPGSSSGGRRLQAQKLGSFQDGHESHSSGLTADDDLTCSWPYPRSSSHAHPEESSASSGSSGDEASRPGTSRSQGQARGIDSSGSQGQVRGAGSSQGHTRRALPVSGPLPPPQGSDRQRVSLDTAARRWGEVEGKGSGGHGEAADLATKLWGAEAQELGPEYGQGHGQGGVENRAPLSRSTAPRNKNLLLTLQQTQMEQKRRQSFSSGAPPPGVAGSGGGDLLPQASSMGHAHTGLPSHGSQDRTRRSIDVPRGGGEAPLPPHAVLRPRGVWESAEGEHAQDSPRAGPGRASAGASTGRPPRNPGLVAHSLPDLPEGERAPSGDVGFPDRPTGTFSLVQHSRRSDAAGSPRVGGGAPRPPSNPFPDLESSQGSSASSAFPRSGSRGSTRERPPGPDQLQSHVSNPWPKAGPHSPRHPQQLVMLNDGTWAAGSESGGAYSYSGGSGHVSFVNHHVASRAANGSLAGSRDSRDSTLERNYSSSRHHTGAEIDDPVALRSALLEDPGPGSGDLSSLPRSGSGQRHQAVRNARPGHLSPLGQGQGQAAGRGAVGAEAQEGGSGGHRGEGGSGGHRGEGGGAHRRPPQMSLLSTDDISLMYAGEGLEVQEAPAALAPPRRARRRSLEGASGGDEHEHEHEEVQRVFQGAAQDLKGHAGARGLAAWGLGKVKGLADPKKLHTSSVLGLAPADIEDSYRMGKVLGEGQFGITRLVVSREGGQEFACKTISKATLKCKSDLEDVRREHSIFEMLKGLKHVPRIQDTFETDQEIHFVMELCRGGDLFDRLKARTRYTEAKAASVVRVVLEVLQYCHDRLLVHRDIKPENILLCSKASDTDVKVIDFGISAQLKPGAKPLTELMGSPFYIAPEVIAGSYGCPADLWSTGVMLYVLLYGVPPFWAKTQAGILRAIREAKLKFQKSVPLSEAARDFIRKLLDRDPARRLTAGEALRHPWLSTAGAAQNWHAGNQTGS